MYKGILLLKMWRKIKSVCIRDIVIDSETCHLRTSTTDWLFHEPQPSNINLSIWFSPTINDFVNWHHVFSAVPIFLPTLNWKKFVLVVFSITLLNTVVYFFTLSHDSSLFVALLSFHLFVPFRTRICTYYTSINICLAKQLKVY